ncbi:helix-turn-helix domain-containing protein [Deferrisoma camini]|uniref:helix-turn-helix domain-containing protein n=1 Tax=Deferrisoma camini TaxID=1035120 RepID=UPI00046D56E7|nr:helix-turn-helix domain-containing protein [Deferrisoma camini]NOY45538.1 helix-turn-helix domain-containing protein [Deltaproteobacteria bacterium]
MKKEVLEKLNLGGKIKELRLQRGMTLKDLAAKTGFSPALLSQVENNLVSPSISTLWNFAEALGVKIGYFFHQEAEERTDYVLTRAGKEALVYRNELPHTLPYRDLAYGYEGRSMSPILLSCDEPCEFSLKELPYEGEEFVHVLEGRIQVEYGGQRFDLGPGDSLYYNAQLPHRIRVGDRARFLAVLYEANRN